MALMQGKATKTGWRSSTIAVAASLTLAAVSPLMGQAPDAGSALAQLERQAETNARNASERVDLARRLHLNGLQAYESGTLTFPDLLDLQVSVAEAEQALVLSRLDVEEIVARGGAVRNEFTAPPVAGRDFIGARLRAELEVATRRLAAVEERLDFAHARVDAGVETPLGLMGVQVEREQLAVDADRLRESVALREQFLAGDIGADEAALRFQLLDATARRELAGATLEQRREVDALMEVRYRAGMATAGERNASVSALLALELDAERAQFDIDRITLALAQLE